MKHEIEKNANGNFICTVCEQDVSFRSLDDLCPGPQRDDSPDSYCPECQQPNGEHKRICKYWTAPKTEGVKFDADKIPYHLIAPELLSAIAEILAFGAKKYAPRNWEKGMAWHRPFRACIGHMWDWWRGEEADPETGKSHLWHAACCIMFLVTYEMRGIGEDDRPK